MTDNSTSFPFHSGTQADQDRLRYAIQAAQIGTWNLDVGQQQVWWDERCQELYGFEGQQVAYEQMLSLLHREDQLLVRQRIEAALDPSSAGYYDVKFRIAEVPGKPLRWLHAQGRAYIDILGSAYRLSGAVRDITAQVLLQQQLEASKARFRSLVHSSPAATVFFVGEDIVIDTVNDSMLRIWGKDETVVGQPLHQVMPQLNGQPFMDLLRRVYNTGEAYHNPKTDGHLVANGQRQESWFSLSCSPVYGPDGAIYGIINTAIDVTAQVVALQESEQRYRMLSEELEQRVQLRTRELAEANEDLKRSNDNLQQFAYVASHDLQEPLRKIQSFGDLLKTQYSQQLGEGTGYIERMQAAASRMTRLIRDLLTFSRISSRQQVMTTVPLDNVLTQTLTDLELVISESRAVIEASPLPVITGDSFQLCQLFQNLITNALKFSRVDRGGTTTTPRLTIDSQLIPQGQLPPTVRPTRLANAYHRVDFSDNGIGFDERYLDRIFQVFQRLHGQNEFAGTGIGLAICQRVVDYHGGAITASSEQGKGATFSVYLPG